MAARFEDPVAARIAAFLDSIGIAVEIGEVPDEFLPGIMVRGGALLVDPARLAWPGDLLHEAGHIAVTAPQERKALRGVADDPGEEMAAIAWSWAAAAAIGLDPDILFHAGGYRGGGAALADNFAEGRDVGVPMLEWYGMAAGRRAAARDGVPPFPHMQRWLR